MLNLKNYTFILLNEELPNVELLALSTFDAPKNTSSNIVECVRFFPFVPPPPPPSLVVAFFLHPQDAPTTFLQYD